MVQVTNSAEIKAYMHLANYGKANKGFKANSRYVVEKLSQKDRKVLKKILEGKEAKIKPKDEKRLADRISALTIEKHTEKKHSRLLHGIKNRINRVSSQSLITKAENLLDMHVDTKAKMAIWDQQRIRN